MITNEAEAALGDGNARYRIKRDNSRRFLTAMLERHASAERGDRSRRRDRPMNAENPALPRADGLRNRWTIHRCQIVDIVLASEGPGTGSVHRCIMAEQTSWLPGAGRMGSRRRVDQGADT